MNTNQGKVAFVTCVVGVGSFITQMSITQDLLAYQHLGLTTYIKGLFLVCELTCMLFLSSIYNDMAV